jgi:hypothetical protein
MTITHDPETGWGFTHGNQPYVGYATRDEACEALFDLEHGKARSPLFYELRTWIRETCDAEDADDDDTRCTYSETRAGILAERMESPDSCWIDFTIGEPARVLIGAHLSGPGASHIEVIIDGTPINERVDDVWVLADLRQLRDDLTALLNDERLVGACQEAAA